MDQEVCDGAGGRSGSTAYSNDGSLCEATVASASIGGLFVLRSGFCGQLNEVVSLAIIPNPATISEGLSCRLRATASFDDGSQSPLDGSDLTWTLVDGPIKSIGDDGVINAANVFTDESASVRGRFRSVSEDVKLTVFNIGNDDFAEYAGDGIPDTWQVQYFGLHNPAAAATADADGSGQTNLFKYIAGLNPVDPTSAFTLRILPPDQASGRKAIVFGPVLSNHTYTVLYTGDLSDPNWRPLSAFSFSAGGTTRTITDYTPLGDERARYYRILISYP